MRRHAKYQLGLVIAAIGALSASAQASNIGIIQNVVNQGYRTPPGQDETTARPLDEVVQDEAPRTAAESAIQVRFVDGSELSVEALSDAVLTEYVFDGAAAAGIINLNDGRFRFVSNGSDDQRVKLRTPVAAIGIRGTKFVVRVDGDDATVVDILSGAVEAIPSGDGDSAICVAGQSILVAGPEPGKQGDYPDRPEPDLEPDPAPDPDPDNDGEAGLHLNLEPMPDWEIG